MKKNILMVGGDGFVGWPATLKLISNGHSVVIVDNLLRRKIDTEMNTTSIVPIASIEERVDVANETFPGKVKFQFIDVTSEYQRLVDVIRENNIDTIIHFGEIKSAAYSMMDAEHANFTISNNVNATANILNAIAFVNPNIHLVHMGTMGVYGYKDDFGAIPEGYLDITVNQTQKQTSIVFPTDPGSVYHMTKSLDQVMFQFYNKNWKIKITDLHQGIIWGCQTPETKKHPKLANRFDYDGTMGSVLNRFIIEGVIGYPLTVHGTGGQSRAFIHLQDSADCVCRAVENPPSNDRVRIFNQTAEVLRVSDLAKYVSETTGTPIQHLPNPRNERADNELFVHNEGLKSLGFVPTLMKDSLVDEIKNIVDNHAHRINRDAIDTTKYQWRRNVA